MTEPLERDPRTTLALDDLYEAERESVVERVDRYADTVFEDEQDEVPLVRRNHHVTAVLVTHDGRRWLAPVMATIDRLDRQPDLIIAVDTGSTDGSDEVMRDWLGDGRVVRCGPSTPFGAAVAAGVMRADELAAHDEPGEQEAEIARPAPEAAPAFDPRAQFLEGWDDDEDEGQPYDGEQPAALAPAADDPGGEVVRWVWLLHDDCAPAPGALGALLDASDTVTSAAVLGPKVLGWHDRRLLLETGVTVTGGGRRVTGLDRGERDQGQHDGLRDVLAVGSAGMLVRRDVWDALDGFDPSLPMFRDDIDFGWRANEAGYRVMVATDAEVHHAEAGIHGRRPLGVVDDSPNRADRESSMRVLLAHARALLIPLVVLRLIVVSLVRSVGLLLAKAPEEAAEEFGALVSTLVRPGRIAASRRLVARTRTVSPRDLAHLRPRLGSQVRHGFEGLVGVITGAGGTAVATAGPAMAGPSEDEAFDDTFDESQGRLAFWVRRPALALALLVTAVSLASVRSWFGSGLLEGGALLPAPPDASDLWATYAQGWHEVGPGAATAAPPYLMVLWLVATALLGSAARAVDAVLMVGVPVAAVVMYLALRRVVGSRLVRALAAATYALLPAAVGAVATGRVGTVVFLILLPALVRTGLRAVVSWRSAWGGALLLAVMTAFVPLSWLVALVCVVLAVVLARGIPALAADRVEEQEDDSPAGGILDPRSSALALDLVPMNLRARQVLLRLGALVVVPLVLLLPWSLDLLRQPSSWFQQAGLPGPVDPALAPWQVALMAPGSPVAAPAWFTLGLLALAAGGLVRRRSRSLAVVAWAFGLVGLVAAVGQVLIEVQPPSESLPLRTWPGPATIVLGLGMVVAAAGAADGIGVRLARDSFSWRQPAAVIALVGALAAPLLAGAWWVWRGVGDTVARGDGAAVPAFVAAQSLGPDRPRSLVFRPSGRGIEYALIDGEGPRLGDAETGPPAAAYDQLNALVGDLMSGRGGNEVDGLGRYGVRFVVLAAPSPELVAVLDSEPGLRRISSAEGDTLWRLDTDSARVRALGDRPPAVALAAGQRDGAVWVDGPLPKKVPAPSSVLLAERADPSWRATLDGVPLSVQDDPAAGWRQGWALTSPTGTLRVWFDQEPRHRWLWLQGLVLVLVVVLALPGRRRPDEDPDADEVGDDDDGDLPAQPVSVPAGPEAPAGQEEQA